MEQGSGKTRVAVELIESTDSELAIFFCPFSTKNNLIEELEKWELKIEFIVIAYETLSASDKKYLDLKEILKDTKGKIFMIADESIFIKNDKTKRFSRIVHLAQYSEYRLIMNGTPITKNEWDIYNQMYFLSPKIINMSDQEFLNTFFTKVEYKKKFQKPHVFYKLSQVNIDVLYKLIEPYIFRSYLDFDKEVKTEYEMIEASMDAFEDYICIKEELLESIREEKPFLHHLVGMQKVAFTDKERCKNIRKRLYGQTIVYCAFLEEVEKINYKNDCYVITGDTKKKDRQIILDKFKEDDKPLLMTYGVGAFGLNLQFCNQIAFSSLTFDYGKIDQAQARIKRLGQKRDIEYIYFTSDLGIYDLIENNLTNKKGLSDLLIEEVKEVFENEKVSRKKRA